MSPVFFAFRGYDFVKLCADDGFSPVPIPQIDLVSESDDDDDDDQVDHDDHNHLDNDGLNLNDLEKWMERRVRELERYLTEEKYMYI